MGRMVGLAKKRHNRGESLNQRYSQHNEHDDFHSAGRFFRLYRGLPIAHCRAYTQQQFRRFQGRSRSAVVQILDKFFQT